MKHSYGRHFLFLLITSLIFIQFSYPLDIEREEELEKVEVLEENFIRAPRPSIGPGGFVGVWSQLPDLTPLIKQVVESILATTPSSSSGSGNVVGPISSTINAVPRFANTLGTLLKNSTVLVDDLGNITIDGITKNGNTVSWPTIVGAAGTFLSSDGAGNLVYAIPAGAGNVSTALPFTVDNAITTVDLVSGVNTIKQSNIILDSSDNISGVNILNANVVNAPILNGNATSATTATSAGSTTNFTGSLTGDVIGTQAATVVSMVGGQTAANVAAGSVLANAATNINTPNAIVKRDASGNFNAGLITADLAGNATTATNALNAINFSGSLAGDVTGLQGATVVSAVGGQTAANVAAGSVLANAATNINTPNAIVKRDASGNFNAGIITADLAGNATTATSATTAGSTTNFTGSLAGDVTGIQAATVVAFVGGQSATNVASGAVAANAATNTNTPNTIVERDASGNFSAGNITANVTGNVTGNLIGNATSATTAGSATNFSGSLNGDVTGTQAATVVNTVGGQTAANVASGSVLANASTSANTASTIVRRDASGNFSAGTITANLTGSVAGNATTATSATTAGSATNFSGVLSGDVTGNQNTTVVALVGGQTAAVIASGAVAANAATSVNTPNTLVKRDASGDFSAGNITANLLGNATSATTAVSTINFSGTLAGDVSGTQGATVVDAVGGQTANNIASGSVAANAATNTNTANTIVKRDASGNFIANVITANLVGDVTGNLIGNATNATTAVSATNFTGPLSGDVTGNQNSTVVSTVGGQTAANVAAATVASNAATSSNSPSTIVRRDGAGNFSAGTITANLTGNVVGNVTGNVIGNVTGNASTATLSVTSTNFSGPLAGDVTGTQAATVVSTVGGETAASVASAAIAVAAATRNDTPNTLVLRDGAGSFATNKITIDGTITNPNDAATKAYVDSVASLGLEAKEPAVVVSTSEVALNGLQTIDGVTLVDGDRILLVAQVTTLPAGVENGLWVVHAGAWTRPADFASGSTAGQAYVLILSGTLNAGSSWLCSTPTAVVDTNPIQFAQFSLPNQTNGANVGTGAGQIFRDKTGVTLNFKTIAAGSHIIVTNNADDVNIATDGSSVNTANTLVARDALGDFSAGTITASLTGAASQNVLKAGDTMTGNLNMAAQSELRLQDAAGGEYVGLRAPTTVGTSYTVDLPGSAPTAGQVLQATSPSVTQWAAVGGSPVTTQAYYVSLDGNDSNDGSFSAPFRTVSHAVVVANSVASLANPVVINVGAGFFAENNTGGPITITAPGISIVGTSASTTSILPFSSAIDLFSLSTGSVEFSNMTLLTPAPGSTATAIAMSATTGGARFNSMIVTQFQTAFSLNNSGGDPSAVFEDITAAGNGTVVSVNNMITVIKNSLFQGPIGALVATNTGIEVTGTNADVAILGTVMNLFETAVLVGGDATLRVLGSTIESTILGVDGSGGCHVALIGSNFNINSPNSINVIASGVNTQVTLDGCQFNGTSTAGIAEGTALKVTTGASLLAVGCSIENMSLGIQCGQVGDSSATTVRANATTIISSINDIQQEGDSTLRFISGVFDISKLIISNPTNVSFAAFDREPEDALTLGNTADVSQTIYQVLNNQAQLQNLKYHPDYYGSKGTAYINPNADPTFNATQAQSNNASYYVVTGDRTKEASINLISDTGNFGVADNIRGWGIDKLGTSGDLAFTYTNNDTSGQAARGSNTVMQLDGFNNQVEFPLATNAPLPTNTVAQLVWAGDTNVYRSAANTLKTDGNLVVGSLTPAGVVHNDVNGLLSTSLIVNADISPSAAITDDKLATITTPGKVANSATTATSSNTPNTIVLRDLSGSFSATNITASLTGTASQNVLKAGDTMTGNLNMAAQTEIRLQDAAGGEYVGLRAPTTVGTSYTVDLPGSAPATGQVLQATSPSVTQWAAVGGSPVTTQAYYVSLDGNDSNDGSFSAPFRTVSHAVVVANSVASLANPVVINVGAGFFAENNTGGPITITAPGISIIGASASATSILPFSSAIDLFSLSTGSVEFSNMTLLTPAPGSTATAIAMSATTGGARFNWMIVTQFQRAFSLNNSGGDPSAVFEDITAAGNGTVVSVNNMITVIKNSLFQGPIGALVATNTGIEVTGTNADVAILGTVMNLFETAVLVGGDATLRVLGSTIESTILGVDGSGGCHVAFIGSNFNINSPNSINVIASGVNTQVTLDGCQFNGTSTAGIAEGTALKVTTGASLLAVDCSIENMSLGIQCGQVGDTSSTEIQANSVSLINCITDVIQMGNSTLRFVGGVFDTNKILITDPTNVSFSAFDNNVNDALTIGDNSDMNQLLFQVLNGQSVLPLLNYKNDYYGNKGTVYVNENADATFHGVQAESNNASTYVVTGDRTKEASINLISDAGNFGVADNIRGWGIDKLGTSGDLAFTYTNNDTSGQAALGSNTVMQLDGFNNQVEFPLATNVPLPTNTVAQLVWAGDTTLSRLAANTLKTDGNFVVGGLTPAGVVHNDVNGLLSTSLIVNADISPSAAITDDKLATITTPGKVANSATTATSSNTPNTIVLRDGSGNFSATTITANLIGNATSANTTTTAANFTGSLAGDVTGTQGATVVSLVGGQTAANVASGAVLANAATSVNTANALVRRDASGNFAAGTITANLAGNATTATNATSATTATSFSGPLIGDVTGTQGATVVSTVGGQTAVNVAAGAVLANASTSVNTPNTIVRRDGSGNFSAGTITASLTGNVTGNLSGNATTATSATTAGTATNFTGSLAGDVTGTQGATVVSLVGGQTAANVATAVTLVNTATSINTPNTLVKRDASGNFVTNMISIAGTVTNPTDVATKSYVDTAISTGLVAKTPAVVVSLTNVVLSGLQTIDGVTLVDTNRVLLVGQTNPVQNGLWVAHAGAWTRPADFASGTVAGQAYVLILSGTVEAGSSWLCNTPTVIIDTNPIGFAEFSLPAQTTGANVGTGAGQIFRDKTGVTLNFKTIAAGTHMVVTNNANDVTLATDATSANTVSTLVARDGSGNFAAGTITANLTGNATSATMATTATTATNFSGSLTGDVTGTQAATVVSAVGGQTAANVAAATVLANAATSSNTVNAIVRRDASGNFVANTITANLAGNATTATTAGSATNFTGPLVGDVTGTQAATVVSIVGGQTAANVASGAVLANAATSANTASTIVRRDASGNFVAGTITANLAGNATTATNATTAGSATNFTGSLIGDVTGTQGATVVSTVGGQTATNVAAGAVLANAATSTNTANTIVKRDASGNFAAGTITANLIGNATTATTAGSTTNFSGSLAGDVTGTQAATVVSTVGGQTATNVASGAVAANAATSTNTANTIVKRDASGNFAAGTITANLTGNVTGNLSGNATTATTAGSATNFTGSLAGDVTGTQAATVVSSVGGQTAANVAAGTVLANAATSSNSPSTIVRRDASGNFNAGTITANLSGNATTATSATSATSAINFTGSLSGDVLGTQGATLVNTVGGQSAGNVAAGTVLANASTGSNVANTIVRRDGSGNFSAGTISANLSGNATSATTAASATNFTAPLAGDVIGNQGSTVVSLVGGQSAGNVAAATVLANAASTTNTPNAIVRRDGSGNFAAGTISANLTGNVTGNLSGNATTATTAGSATNFSGSLAGDVTGVQGATVVSTVGGQTAADVAAATVLANAATSANTASTIVRRDASGNFNAGTITGSLTGAASLNVLKTGDTMTGGLTVPAGTTAVPSLQFTGSTNTGLSSPIANTLSFSTSALQRMNIDTTGSVTYKSNYKLYAYRSTNQTINNTTATIIFDVELLDPNANYNTVTGIYTVPVTGTYMINVTITAQTAAQPSTQTVNIVKNGVVVTGASVSQVLSSNLARQPMTTCVLLPLVAGDLIRLDCTTTKNDSIIVNDTHLAISYMSF